MRDVWTVDEIHEIYHFPEISGKQHSNTVKPVNSNPVKSGHPVK
jgi:hypothetical protein